MVLIPDYFRGRSQNPTSPGTMEFIKDVSQWSKLKLDWEERVLPYAKKHGAKTFGAMGE